MTTKLNVINVGVLSTLLLISVVWYAIFQFVPLNNIGMIISLIMFLILIILILFGYLVSSSIFHRTILVREKSIVLLSNKQFIDDIPINFGDIEKVRIHNNVLAFKHPRSSKSKWPFLKGESFYILENGTTKINKLLSMIMD